MEKSTTHALLLVVIEGVVTQMKFRDRKLIDRHLAMAVDKNVDIVESNNFWQVEIVKLVMNILLFQQCFR